MKRIYLSFFAFFLFVSPVFTAPSAFSYVPDETFAFVTLDIKSMSENFLKFLDDENSAASVLNDAYKRIYEKLGKPLSESQRSAGFFGNFAEELKKLRDSGLGSEIDKIHVFFLPGIIKNPNSPRNLLLIVEGNFNLSRLRGFAEKASPDRVFEITHKNFKGIEVKGKVAGEATWAVKIGTSLLIASKYLLKEKVLLKTKGESIFKRKRFAKKSIKKWRQASPYILFFSAAYKKNPPYKYCVLRLTKKVLEIRAQVKDREEAEKYVKELDAKREFALSVIPVFKNNKKIPFTRVMKKGFNELTFFLKSLKVTHKKGRVVIKAGNPGMNGFSHFIAGLSDFILKGWIMGAKELQKKQK
ncbi:hypothetical protein ACFL35_05605 [Candidatus Riflebacteria bacterium]